MNLLRDSVIQQTLLVVALALVLVSSSSCAGVQAKRKIFRADVSSMLTEYEEHVIPKLDEETRDRRVITISDIRSYMALTGLIPTE